MASARHRLRPSRSDGRSTTTTSTTATTPTGIYAGTAIRTSRPPQMAPPTITRRRTARLMMTMSTRHVLQSRNSFAWLGHSAGVAGWRRLGLSTRATTHSARREPVPRRQWRPARRDALDRSAPVAPGCGTAGDAQSNPVRASRAGRWLHCRDVGCEHADACKLYVSSTYHG